MLVSIEDLDQLRIEADYLIQFSKAIITSAETTLAWRNLQMAKGFLGKIKGELGAENPYPVATEAQNIPPTAEVSTKEVALSPDRLYNVNHLRQHIKDLIRKKEDVFGGRIGLGEKSVEYIQMCTMCLEQASMYLGLELAEIREKEKAKDKAS